jgi:hypothetical protein
LIGRVGTGAVAFGTGLLLQITETRAIRAPADAAHAIRVLRRIRIRIVVWIRAARAHAQVDRPLGQFLQHPTVGRPQLLALTEVVDGNDVAERLLHDRDAQHFATRTGIHIPEHRRRTDVPHRA